MVFPYLAVCEHTEVSCWLFRELIPSIRKNGAVEKCQVSTFWVLQLDRLFDCRGNSVGCSHQLVDGGVAYVHVELTSVNQSVKCSTISNIILYLSKTICNETNEVTV